MQGRRGENDDVYGIGPSVNISFPEHISESTCLIVFKFYTQHLGGLVVPFGEYEL